MRAEVTTAVLDPAALAAVVDDPRCGAVVTFAGVVRNHDEGRGVAALAYSAHPTAQAELAAVVAQFADVPGVHAIAVAHRIGDLAVGDVALAAAVAGNTVPRRSRQWSASSRRSRRGCRSGSISTSAMGPPDGRGCDCGGD